MQRPFETYNDAAGIELKNMTHQEKVDHLIAELGKEGMSSYTVAPPLFRLLWALGLRVPPPLFLGFFTVALFAGFFFGLFWGAFMWLIQWRWWKAPVELAVFASVLAGLLFGVSMGAYYRWKARQLKLPRWEDYPPT